MVEVVVDLTTLWWLRILSALLVNIVKGAYYSVSYTDTTGTSRTQNILYGGRSTEALSTGCGDHYTYIGFGSDPTPASDINYKLISELAVIPATVSVEETLFEIRIQAAYTPTTDVTVCEVGLYISACDSGGALRRILVDRTVLSPCIDVTAGSTISVLYKVKA